MFDLENDNVHTMDTLGVIWVSEVEYPDYWQLFVIQSKRLNWIGIRVEFKGFSSKEFLLLDLHDDGCHGFDK